MKNETNTDTSPIKLFLVDDDALFLKTLEIEFTASLGSCLHEPYLGEMNSVREDTNRGAGCTRACAELEEEYTILKNTNA